MFRINHEIAYLFNNRHFDLRVYMIRTLASFSSRTFFLSLCISDFHILMEMGLSHLEREKVSIYACFMLVCKHLHYTGFEKNAGGISICYLVLQQ